MGMRRERWIPRRALRPPVPGTPCPRSHPLQRLQGSSNTASPSAFTRFKTLLQVFSQPISQACLKLRAALIGLRGSFFPSLSSIPRVKQPPGEFCWRCASRVRASTRQASGRPASQAFCQKAGSLPGCFPPRKPVTKQGSDKSHPDPHESRIRLLGSPGRKRMQGPELPRGNPPPPGEPAL